MTAPANLKKNDGELKVAPDGSGWICPGCNGVFQQGFIGRRPNRRCRACWDAKNGKLTPSMELVKPSVEVMSTPLAQARARTNRLKVSIENFKEALIDVWDNEDWRTLNYPSWDDYCLEELGCRIPVPKSERADLVLELRNHGMSFRAIASAVDMSEATVRRAGASNDAPETITGLDGKTYRPRTTKLATRLPARRVLDNIINACNAIFPTGSPALPVRQAYEQLDHTSREVLMHHAVVLAMLDFSRFHQILTEVSDIQEEQG